MTEAYLQQKSYRFIMKCHLSQNSSATDNTKWGHHWGSPIVIERMANFVDILKPYMPNEDLRLWHNMLIDEANYHLETSVQTNRFSSEGETHAERNYWRGSTLFRVAQEISNHKNVPLWLEKSSEFCVNALSVPDDAYCNVVVDGKPVNGRFIGANAHPEFVFEHHGAISIDYSIHTESFFTMIMISVLRNNWQPSDALSHHMGDVWNFVRQCILPSGNIAFIGGLQRPRYAITQSYLLPCLLFWHHYGCDSGAKKLAEQVLTIISHLRDESKDGSFYSTRAVALRMKRNIHPQLCGIVGAHLYSVIIRARVGWRETNRKAIGYSGVNRPRPVRIGYRKNRVHRCALGISIPVQNERRGAGVLDRAFPVVVVTAPVMRRFR